MSLAPTKSVTPTYGGAGPGTPQAAATQQAADMAKFFPQGTGGATGGSSVNPLDQVYPSGQGGFNYIPNPQAPASPVTWDQVKSMGLMPSPTQPSDPTQVGNQTATKTPAETSAGTSAVSQNANPTANASTPVSGTDQLAGKYQQLSNMGAPPRVDLNANPRTYIGAANSAYQNVNQSQDAYQPSQPFMQVGDPIMQSFILSALGQQQDINDKGFLASKLKATFGNQLANLNTEEMNLQNMMRGTVDDIRSEISKAGGFATEGQVQGLVTYRNKDLIRQFNSLEIQKSNMQNQMTMQVQLADMDRQYAQDKYQNTLGAYQLYKGIYDNTTSQIDKLIQNVGYQGLAQSYNNDPYVLSLAEQHLSMPQGTLSDPTKLAALETYRQKTLNLSASRFNAMYGYSPNGVPTGGNGTGGTIPGGGTHPQTNPNVSYEQYGLLSNTDFNPKDGTDQTALNYLNVYLNNGTVPNASAVGLRGSGNIVSQKFQAATTRANDLYFAATGQNLPAPGIIKSQIGIISANNKLANNLKVQENTVNANFGLSLQNLNANNLNTAWPILNNAINNIKNAEGDPNVAQYFAQNSTIQQELGNLLAVKNAMGTTVYDKIAGAGLLPKNATPAQQIQVVKTLLSEAKNASNAFKQVNAELYSQIDPLERQKDNPNRQSHLNAPASTDVLMTYTDGKQYYISADKVEEAKKHGYK